MNTNAIEIKVNFCQSQETVFIALRTRDLLRSNIIRVKISNTSSLVTLVKLNFQKFSSEHPKEYGKSQKVFLVATKNTFFLEFTNHQIIKRAI